jgi:hypothetical protein
MKPTPISSKEYERLVVPRQHLWWDVRDKRALSLESVVEGILNRGNWNDVQALFEEVGLSKVMHIFKKQIKSPRTNYKPQTINFFNLYFERHA